MLWWGRAKAMQEDIRPTHFTNMAVIVIAHLALHFFFRGRERSFAVTRRLID
jgi:hypothetical protein